MLFQTKYNYKEKYSKSGTGKIPVFKSRLDKNGKLIVVPKMLKDEKGKLIQEVDNVYAKIQASADSVDIATIIKKYTNTGDESILHTNPGIFMDMTEMKNPMETMNMINDIKDTFNHLPIDVKAKFDNDYKVFLAQAGTKEFYANLGYKDLNNDGIVTKSEVETQTKKVGEDNA